MFRNGHFSSRHFRARHFRPGGVVEIIRHIVCRFVKEKKGTIFSRSYQEGEFKRVNRIS